MNIYIVTCGEYSDYHIERIFTDYKKAEQYVALQNRNPDGYQEEWNIECHSTFDDNLQGEIKVYYLYTFNFLNGEAKIIDTEIVGYQKKEFFYKYRYDTDLVDIRFRLTIDEESEEKALKIAQDEYAKKCALEF